MDRVSSRDDGNPNFASSWAAGSAGGGKGGCASSCRRAERGSAVRLLRAARWLWTAACAGALAVSTGGVSAAQPNDPKSVAADALYSQANALMAKGNFEQACAKYRASNDLDVGVGTLLRLGDCYEKASRFASAQRAFADAQRVALEQDDGARASLAAVRMAALRPRIPRLALRIEPAVLALSGFHVLIDEQLVPAGRLAQLLELDAGQHVAEARAPGRKAVSRPFVVRNDAGEPFVVSISDLPELIAAPPAPVVGLQPPQATQDRGRSDKLRKLSWVVGGVGAAALVGGGVLAILASDKNSAADAECDRDDPASCNPRGTALREDAQSMADVALVLGVAGAVTLGGSVTMYLLAPSSSGTSKRSGGAGWGLRLEGRF